MLKLDEVQSLVDQIPHDASALDGVIGCSPCLLAALEELARYAQAVNLRDARAQKALSERDRDTFRPHPPLLLFGETGTGKELFAKSLRDKLIHRNKTIIHNCGTTSAERSQSDLFGHKKGSFTGATDDRAGRFREADGQVLFLDELGEFHPGVQAILNRAIENGMIEPVGETETGPYDVIVVGATNRDLRQAVLDGQFRQDLLARFEVFVIEIPPLRERKQDIPLITQYFLYEVGHQMYGIDLNIRKDFHIDTVFRMVNYDWPENVRQLRNVVTGLIAKQIGLASISLVEPDHLPSKITNAPFEGQAGPAATAFVVHQHTDEELLRIIAANPNKTKAEIARELGYKESTFRKRVNKAGAPKSSPGAPGKHRRRQSTKNRPAGC